MVRIGRRGFLGTSAGMSFARLAGSRARGATGPTLPRLDTRSFAKPTAEFRPWVYWFWINGNVTRTGVTADLEAMARVGIGGVLIMDVDPGTPPGDALFGSPDWHAMLAFAFDEAQRLGLEINLNNAAGWAGSAGPWITPDLSMQKLVFTERTLAGGEAFDGRLQVPETIAGYYRDVAVLAFPTPVAASGPIDNLAFKAGFVTNVGEDRARQGVPAMPIELPALPSDTVVAVEAILDLTRRFENGRLDWTPPGGNWTILRLGHSSTGTDNHPVADAGRGLECDKMSKAAVGVHFAHFLGRVTATEQATLGKTLVSVHIDSWEAGAQNWTAAFPAEFATRRGYSITPWLPVMAGHVVGDAERADRFLWDLRQTISELIVENYAGEMHRLARKAGVRLSIEGYDGDQTAQMAYGGVADEPQAEFWLNRDFFPDVHRSPGWVANMTSAAHTNGRRVIASEAFTAMPDEKWQAHPATMKPIGDWAFSKGINRLIIHRYAMQPWTNRAPGMTMGAWGVHYERTQTWWEMSGPYHEYLTRCQYMLRQGLPVADILYLTPEGAPMRFAPPDLDLTDTTPPDTPGYNYDGCTPETLDRVTVRDGAIVLPDGMRYRMLVLPPVGGPMPGGGTMTPRLLRRIVALVEQGMTLVGDPPLRSAGLAGYPGCDAAVTALAARLWGAGDGVAALDRRVGLGRVIRGRTPQQVLGQDGIAPDFATGEDASVRYVHRTLDDGGEIYFVANKQAEAIATTCVFRAGGRAPEIWHPETGRIVRPALYHSDAASTRLPIALDPHEAVFVVFPGAASVDANRVTGIEGRPLQVNHGTGLRIEADHAGPRVLIGANGVRRSVDIAPIPGPLSVTGPWTVRFPPALGAPPSITLDRLASWSEHADAGVRHFSGTATYSGTVEVPVAMLEAGLAVRLDLGEVAEIARVMINGRDMGIAWKPPFAIDVTAALKPGRNVIAIAVTNLWPNRIIGDAALPDDVTWKPNPYAALLPGFGDTLSEWPAWLKDGKPSPTGRITFATWRLWDKGAPLLRSGLLGPVTLSCTRSVTLAT